MTTDNRSINWLRVAILVIAGGVIYILPYLRYGYYDAMMEALKITNSEMGYIMSAYAVFALPGYFFGGFLADKFSAKNLLSFAFISTGVGGFYMMTFPGYMQTLLLHCFWGISTTLLFWPAYWKVVRFSAGEDQQGTILGVVHGARKIFSLVVSSIGVWVFAMFAVPVKGFTAAIAFFSVVHIAVGLLFYFCFKEEGADAKTEDKKSDSLGLKDIVVVMKMPLTWYLSGFLFSVYFCYRFNADFMTTYLSKGIGISAVLAGFMGYAKQFGIAGVSSGCGGYAVNKFGATKTNCFGVVVGVGGALLLAVVPMNAANQYFAIGAIILYMFGVWMSYSMWNAFLEEAKIPSKITGSIIGVVSTIGFTPEVIVPLIGGGLLDSCGLEAGFRYMWLIAAGTGSMAFVFLYLIVKTVPNVRDQYKAAAHRLATVSVGK